MKNIKLAVKLFLGFGVVLLLTGVVAYMGFNGLNTVAHSVELGDDANRLVKYMLEARQDEKNFMLRGFTVVEGDTQGADGHMRDLVVEFKAQVAELLPQLSEEEAATLTTLGGQFEGYELAFEEYVNEETVKEAADAEMVEHARETIDVAEEMRADQKEKLFSEIEGGADAAAITDRLTKADDANRVIKWLLEARRDEKNYMIRGDQESVDNVGVLIEDAVALLEDMKVRFSDAANDAQADAVIAAAEAYHAAFDDYIAAAEEQLGHEEEMVAAARLVVEEAEALRAVEKENMETAQSTATTTALGAAGVAIVVGLAMALIITQGITGPIGKLRAIAESVAEGDLEVSVDIEQKDEMGQLADSFRRMIDYMQEMAAAAGLLAAQDLTADIKPQSERDVLGNAFEQMITNLRAVIGEVTDTANNVGSAAQQLSSAADQAGQATGQITTTIQQVADGTAQQTESITQAATSVDELSRAIDGVAQGAQEQAAAIGKSSELTGQISSAVQEVATTAQSGAEGAGEAAQAAEDGAGTVRQTIEAMEKIKSSTEEVAQRIAEMGRRSDEIGAIVEQIDDIASQTNLLALNASIEAARAGEHGKGFAVVADAVGKLADDSAGATKEIAALIKGIQETVNEGVRAMDESVAEVEMGAKMANESGEALDKILTVVNAVTEQVQGIAAAGEEMQASADELVGSIDSVSAVIEENTAATEEMAASSGEVSGAIEGVASVSEENSAAAEEVSAATEEMSAQVEEVNASAQSMSAMAQQLQALVAQFKLEGDGGSGSEDARTNG